MTDIMKLINDATNFRIDFFVGGKKCDWDNYMILMGQLESRISAMQEVCEAAAQAVDRNMINIHGKGCMCEHCSLIRTLDKLNEVIA